MIIARNGRPVQNPSFSHFLSYKKKWQKWHNYLYHNVSFFEYYSSKFILFEPSHNEIYRLIILNYTTMQFRIKSQMFFQFTEDFRDLLQGIGITHLVNEGKFDDFILTFDIEYQELIRANFSQFLTLATDAFILTPQILFPVSNEAKNDPCDNTSIWKPNICFNIEWEQLQNMFRQTEATFYVFFNEHYAPYLSRGLQYIKTGRKFIEEYKEQNTL